MMGEGRWSKAEHAEGGGVGEAGGSQAVEGGELSGNSRLDNLHSRCN